MVAYSADPAAPHEFLPMLDTPDYCARCWGKRGADLHSGRIIYPDVSLRYAPAMTDTTDHGTTGPAVDELEAARQRVRDLEAAQQAEAAAAAEAAAHAAEDAQAAELTPDVPEEPNAVNDLPDGTRGVIAEIFDHLGNLARTLGEHAREIAALHASKGATAPAATTLDKGRGFALDTEQVASMAADPETGVEPGFAGPGTGDGPAPG